MKYLTVFGCTALLAAAAPAQLLTDDLSYPDGPLTTASGGLWTYISGSGGALSLNVSGQRAFIDQNDGISGRDDYSRALGSTFDPATDNTSQIYVSFVVNFSALPFNTGSSTAGSYFAHLKASAPNEFYARVGANQEGAAAGKFRLAISNEGWATATTFEFPMDLDLNTDYRVVTRLDLALDQTTLWVDPLNEASLSVTATDPIGYAAGGLINAYALRQGTSGSTGGPGDLFVDNLRVATSFAAVVPEPGAASFLALGGLMTLVRRGRRS